MKQTRLGVFETNSSSMHSIVVMKDRGKFKGKYKNFLVDFYVDEDGEWEIWNENDLQFGSYPFRILVTFADKFYYAVASLCSYYNDGLKEPPKESVDMFNKLTEIVKKYVPSLKKITVPMYTPNEYFSDGVNPIDPEKLDYDEDTDSYTYNGKSVNVKSLDLPYFGYVDHESSSLLQDFLDKQNITLEEFLTNKKYLVVVDGDAYCEFEKLLNSGLINKKRIDYEFEWNGKHEVK